MDDDWTAESLALFTQAALQGAFILAKARNGMAPAIDAVDHLHRYIELLFNRKGDAMKLAEHVNLTEQPELVTWPEMHYVFVERIGPFMENAGAAWQLAHPLVPALLENNKIAGYMALYKIGPKIYRAGFSLAALPVKLPDGLRYEKFHGGKYVRFVLTGPYDNLPQASGRVWAIVGEKKIQVRDDFAIENYVNDPRVTPAEQLITHIMIPTL